VTQAERQLTPVQKWILAARPKTLPAAAAPVVVGSAAAFHDGAFDLLPALAALIGALLLQIGANIANDYFDFFKGADTSQRLGPLRVTQAGLLKPPQVWTGMWVVFGTAALLGIYLTYEAGWPVVVIGLASIAAAILYTGGPFPIGYNGLGEVFVFIFFGLAATVGTYFVQAKTVTALAWWTALPPGFLIVAILIVNNLRDIRTDTVAGKRTMATRLGETGTKIEFFTSVVLAYLVPPLMILLDLASPWVMLSWLSLVLLPGLGRRVLTVKGKPLNQALAETGRLALVFGVLFGLGLVLGNF